MANRVPHNPASAQLSDPTISDVEYRQREGVPSLDDQFIQNFLEKRDALVEQEKKQRSDRVFRENLSPTAAEACAIVDQIRFEEQQTLWTKEFEDSFATGEGDIYPGMMFSLAKERMEKSKLWQIVRRMPKGALLHCHIEAMVDLNWAIDEALKTDGFCIKALAPLSDGASRLKSMFFFGFSKWTKAGGESIWKGTYEANTFVPLVAAADAFPDGGRSGFIEWLRSRCTITPDESLKHHFGPNDIWRKFLSCFPILGSIIYYEPIFRQFIYRMCQSLHEDGVQWVDMRTVFLTPFTSVNTEGPDEDYSNMLRILIEEIERFQNSEEGKDFWGARMIWTTRRSDDVQGIVEHMKQCIAMKKKYPDTICGYDLVGQEDLGRPLQDLMPELFWFKKRCAEEGVDIPFYFHAGETLGDGDTTDENLFDAIILGTRRIGHGFSLYKHPLLIDMVKEKKILIESCPVSNEVLRLCSSIMSNPLPALLARGVPVALCNDDPTILGQESLGMTHDFWQALQAWDNLGLAGLGSMAENSVRWASFDDCSNKEWLQDLKEGVLGKTFRAECLKEWMAKWERFCQWIVTEYGVDEDLRAEE